MSDNDWSYCLICRENPCNCSGGELVMYDARTEIAELRRGYAYALDRIKELHARLAHYETAGQAKVSPGVGAAPPDEEQKAAQ